MKEPTIEEVIEDLRKMYEKAQRLDFVKTPAPYALYKVWRKYDSMAKRTKRNEAKTQNEVQEM